MWIEFWLFMSAYLLTWPFLAVLFLAGIFFEHTRCHGWAVFTGILAIVVGYFYLDISVTTLVKWSIGYLVVGVVWSFWRYNSFVSESVKAINESGSVGVYLREKVEALAPGKNLNLITTWILIWPFSAVEHIVGDLITFIQTLVTKVFRSVYAKIYTAQIGSLKNHIE